MLPITKVTPKPLLKINGKALIEYHIEGLARAGIGKIVINTSYLGEEIEAFCLRKEFLDRCPVDLHFSREKRPLETAGGIIQALPKLGKSPFLLVSADVYTQYPFETLVERQLATKKAHLVMVSNPTHNPDGDFVLFENLVRKPNNPSALDGSASFDSNTRTLTFSGIGLFDPSFFLGCPEGRRPLRGLLEGGIDAGMVSGEHYFGEWRDIGTPERWEAAKIAVANRGFTV
jgi:MurNAc alpha-1-phosphate uridylyltransferase